MLVEVALPVPVRGAFTYEVPQALRERVLRGARARVPFGSRRLVGVILGITGKAPSGGEVKEVEEILDTEPLLPGPVLELGFWLADYYQAPLGEALKLALPLAGPRGFEPLAPGGRGRIAGEGGARSLLVRLAPGAGERIAPLSKRASSLRALLDALSRPSRHDGWMTFG